MNFGVPKEVRPYEYRVGLTTAGVSAIVSAGHQVYVEHNAGVGAGFTDEDYRSVGANIAYSAEEVFGRADVVTKVARITQKEYPLLRYGQTLLSYLHLAVSSRDLSEQLIQSKITAIAYEMIQTDSGMLPVLQATSAVAGRMAPIIAGELLQSTRGGQGILLSGIPGVSSAEVAILGGGVVGVNAARAFLGIGAQVIVVDKDFRKLEQIDNMFNGVVNTMVSTQYNIERVLKFANVVIGAVLVPGKRSPVLITRDMLRLMRQRAVFIDYSIDQGGCSETSRPTTHFDPTYIDEGVIHFAVPNVPARVSRTASHALTNAALPYLLQLGAMGIEEAIEVDNSLRRGVQVLSGELIL